MELNLNMIGDLYFDDIFVNCDEEMEVFDILFMVFLFEVVVVIGMCLIIFIGNGLFCVLSFCRFG